MKKHLLKLSKHATPNLNDAERIVPENPTEDIIHSLCDCSILNTNLQTHISTPQINHCLYISCAKVANDLSQLKKYYVHSILSIDLSITKYSYIRGGYLDISLTSSNLEKYREILYKASKFIAIKLKEGNLLICCYSGFSKSCMVFISYLMFRHKCNLIRSTEILRSIRPNVKIDSKSNGELVKLETFMIKYADMI
jgi:protein-tyrosine phosphatase